ncbi:uncharacterized protein LOC121412436 [Lytechinus variegatus]|uniref:uncharacterized protein LOC121412436 n=1 Tax=Lytechinus variegatus TaxID=7654 RepID=UPI001BB2C9E5|nr:uncharacterized protein LOC121412436 [Lytechinus variegatus]
MSSSEKSSTTSKPGDHKDTLRDSQSDDSTPIKAKTEQSEDVASMRHSCQGYVRSLARQFQELEFLMLSGDNFDDAELKYSQLKGTFLLYERKCKDYFRELSSDEKRAEMKLYESQMQNKAEFDRRYSEWADQMRQPVVEDLQSENSDKLSVRSSATRRSGSSRASGLSSSSSRLRDVKVKAHLAKLKLEQLKKAQEVKREQERLKEQLDAMEIENEIKNAEVEAQLLEDIESEVEVKVRNYNDVNDIMHVHVPHRVNKEPNKEERPTENVVKDTCNTGLSNLNPNAPVWQTNQNAAQGLDLTQLFQALNLSANLPKPDLMTFNGKPIDYQSFINNFEINIEGKIADNRTRLMYLIQYCSGVARSSIENCVLMGGDLGYIEAKRILREQFGQPYVVAQDHLKKVLNRPQVKSNDGAGMWSLARDMQRCQMVLSQMGYMANVNNSDNLLKIQQLLPIHLQSEWAKQAHRLMENNAVPTFEVMTTFVEKAAKLANNMFGQNIGRSSPKEKTQPSKTQPKRKGTTLTTQGNSQKQQTPGQDSRPSNKCPCCSNDHRLSACKVFKLKPYEDRFKLAQKVRVCFNCLLPSHMAKNCTSEGRCRKEGCQKKHHTLLHSSTKQSSRTATTGAGEREEIPPEPVSDVTEAGQCHSVSSRKKVCLRAVPVKVRGKDKDVFTWALLDQGSDVSLCDRKLVEELGIQGVKRSFQLTTVDTVGTTKTGLEVSLKVENIQDHESITMPRVWTVESLPISESCIPDGTDVNKWPHLRGIELPRIEKREVRILIGADTPEAFWVMEQRIGKRKEPYAVRSLLGWTLLGPTRSADSNTPNHVNFARLEEQRLDDQLKQFWTTDFGAYMVGDKVGESIEDRRARKMMEESTSLVDGHYEVGLPWRHSPAFLPDSRKMAASRLHYLKGKFNRNEEMYKKYNATVQEYIDKGYAEEVEPYEHKGSSTKPLWYLPHHPVLHPHKPNKVRVVFDCAARSKGQSLNDQLLQGPDYTNSLVGVLTRFRQEPIALVADVEAMFHQVKVRNDDRDALRFLWWKDGDTSREPSEYRMTVHLFGATSSPSIAGYALRKTADDNETTDNHQATKIVRRNFYVDDCLTSVKSAEEASRLVNELRELLSKGGFRLTKWISNDRNVLSSVPETERAASVPNMDLDKLPVERTLGILWDVDQDSFGFQVNIKEKPTTRRGILSTASSLYDPLGFVAPFVLPAKALLQKLCREGLGWDEPIPEDDEREWSNWLQSLPILTGLKIDRCLKPTYFKDVVSAQLHHFCDASEIGYSSVAYLRLTEESGRIHCAFVMGKSRLSPLKTVSIPRLELSAAVLAVDVNRFLQEELDVPVNETFYWTDSTAVLQYIRNESRRFHTFVANRVAKIHEASHVSQWRHVGTKNNPADDGSRGMTAKELIDNPRWLQGPQFLQQDEENWPAPPEVIQELSADDLEVKKVQVHTITSKNPVDELITRYSSWISLLRGVAWLLRYKQYLKSRGDDKTVSADDLSPQELKAAEVEVIRYVQNQSFPEEMNESSTRQKSSRLDKLHPIKVDGLLRVGGRLSRAPLTDEEKHPIILPNDHHVTTLIIKEHHQQVGHSGAVTTWTALRQKFWVLRGGTTVRKIIGNCFKCKRRNSPRGKQIMADLPEERVTPDRPPFTTTGLDYFGPFLVKRGRSQEKRYGCVFTCLASRAVHLEVAHSLDTDSFINALRRFINRRGCPDKIYSDNGTNFKSGHRELKESITALNSKKVGRYLAQTGIQWEFNPPGASHMGGVWERIIRSVRKILESLLNQQTLTDESLLTLLTEVEAILNARPLTKISLDPRDHEPLTPNHLLLLRRSQSLPPGIFNKEDCYVRKRWRQVQYMADQFWKRWVKEYLPLLQERQKWTKPQRNFEPNDLVLIADDNFPRGQWPLGRVVETYPDKQGRVRQVEVRVGSKILKRPISKLCLLEAHGHNS